MIFKKAGVDLSNPANFAPIGNNRHGHTRAGRHRRSRRGIARPDDQR
jgi:hypothetical protein